MADREDVKTVFRITGWDEKPYLEAEGMKLARAHYGKTYRGELEGTSTTESLLVYRPDGSSSFVELEHFVGSVRGRAGTLVIQSEGTFSAGVVESRGVVVAGAGTGALRDVSGTVPYKAGHAEEYPMVFSLTLP